MSAEQNDSSLPPSPASPEGTGQVVLYRTEDGQTRIQVRLVRDSAWLNLNRHRLKRRGWLNLGGLDLHLNLDLSGNITRQHAYATACQRHGEEPLSHETLLENLETAFCSIRRC